jgi:hypothetical protein
MSNSKALRSLIVAAAVVATTASAQSARQVQKRAAAEVVKLRETASEPLIVAAVKKQNARELPLVATKVLDQRWFVGKESVLKRQTISGPCADRLRELLTANAAYTEAVVLDNQGAVVCANARTPNYWYGDQPRWQRAFAGETFTDLANKSDALISVPVLDEGRAIGAITIRVKLTS